MVLVRFYDLDKDYRVRGEFVQTYESVTLTGDTLRDEKGNTLAYLDPSLDAWQLTDMMGDRTGAVYSDVDIEAAGFAGVTKSEVYGEEGGKGNREEGKGNGEEGKGNGDVRHYAVFCATKDGELAMPCVAARGVEEACALVDSEIAGQNSWDVLDAMDSRRLLEVVAMLMAMDGSRS